MKQRKGCLIKRSSGYYCRIMVDGKLIIRALYNPDNTPCKTLIDARKAQGDFTKPFTLASKADATQAILTRLTGIKDESTRKPTIAGCWDTYLQSGERPDSGQGTLKNYQRHLQHFTEWVKKEYPQAVYLSDVSKPMASDYSRHLVTVYSNNLHNKSINFLSLLFRILEVPVNPFALIRRKPKDATPHEALTVDQIQRVLSLAQGELHTLLLIGVYTALRRKDASLLKWNSVDMEKGVITVMPAKTASRSHKVVSIPIHPVLKARLETLFRKGEYVLPKVAFWYQHNPAHISKRIRDLFEKAGIETQLEVDGKKGTLKHNKSVFSFHSLRFSMGQALISNGYSLDQIAQVLGHTNIQMTRHYSNITDTVREKAILSLPSIGAATA